MIRIALIAGAETAEPANNQLYVPEIVHIVTLVAGVGSTIIRKSVYGIFVNLAQSLYLARPDEGPVPDLLQLIQDVTSHEDVLNLFGLSRVTATSEYSNFDVDKEKLVIRQQEKLTALLVRFIDVSAGSKGKFLETFLRYPFLISLLFQVSSTSGRLVG